MLVVAVQKCLTIYQLDINNAFLHVDLYEEVYMKIPQGLAKKGDTRVCCLRKSLYGMRQALRNWYNKFTKALRHNGFQHSMVDHSLFVFKQNDIFIFAFIYVDDVILLGNNTQQIEKVKAFSTANLVSKIWDC